MARFTIKRSRKGLAFSNRQRTQSDPTTLRDLPFEGAEPPEQPRTVSSRVRHRSGEQHGRHSVGYIPNFPASLHISGRGTIFGHTSLAPRGLRLLQTGRWIRPRDVVHRGDSDTEHGTDGGVRLFRKFAKQAFAYGGFHFKPDANAGVLQRVQRGVQL